MTRWGSFGRGWSGAGAACLLVPMLLACSPGGGEIDPAGRPDPAMQPEPAQRGGDTGGAAAGGDAPDAGPASSDFVAAGPPEPQQPRLDPTGERIFVPGLGWMDTRRFWRMYEHEPHELPPDLDLAAVHHLKQQADQHGAGEAR